MAHGLAARRRTVVITLVSALLVLGAGFLAGRLVQSPAQHAADAKGPGPTMLTVPVVLRTLTAQVVTRGDVSAGTQSDIPAPTGSGASGSSIPIVTRIAVRVGDQFTQGRLLAEVSGRPVFALAGQVPAYRDLRPGFHGSDVRQLQVDLADLHFFAGAVNGRFGDSTKTAVTKFYESIGDEPLPANDSDAQDRQAAEQAVQQARWTVQDDQTALAGALTAAHGRRHDPTVRTADVALSRARTLLSQARDAQAGVIARTGPMIPLGEYSFIPSFPARVATMRARVGGAAPSPLMAVASGQLRAVGTVNAGQAALVKPGLPVDVLLESTNATAKGVVASVGTASETGATADATSIVVTPRGDWPSSLWGQNVRLTINGATTDGKQLVVPVSALFASADGSTRLVVSRKSRQTDVTVTVGVVAGGYAAVAPSSGALVVGDQVLISADNISAGGGR